MREDALLAVLNEQPGPEETLQARERLNSLDAALASLAPKPQQALLLSRVQGSTHAEVAARLNGKTHHHDRFLPRSAASSAPASCFRTMRGRSGMSAEQDRLGRPYTRALLSSVLTPEPGLGIPDVTLGDAIPDPSAVPPGCRFHPRCSLVLDICMVTAPPRLSASSIVGFHFEQ
jgi:oligopeptide/dipeptide ABC transporter ATP-binding protein